MKCPKCRSHLETVAFEDAAAHRCTHCQGIWFDTFDHEQLKPQAEKIDVGDAEKGAEFNKIDRIACPACPDSQLLRMIDPQQPHIWFESCPTCHGRFYDAGEYRDYSEYTIQDFIKGLSAPPRE